MKFGRRARLGFTLLELLIAIVIVGVALAVVTPSIKRYLETQRVRSVSSEMLGDIQFARTEAVARGKAVGIKFETAADRTCYTMAVFDGPNCQALLPGVAMVNCSCTSGIGSACTAGAWAEVKTVSVPHNRSVQITRPMGSPSAVIAFDPTSGNLTYCNTNLTGAHIPVFNADVTGDSTGVLRTQVVQSGRPRTCRFSGDVPGAPAC